MWSGLAWPGLAWSGLVWSGLVWSGLVWSGLVRSELARSVWSGWSGLVWSSWSGHDRSGMIMSSLAGLAWFKPELESNVKLCKLSRFCEISARPLSLARSASKRIGDLGDLAEEVKTGACDGRESNPGQLLGRQLCSPLYHHRWLHCFMLVLAAPVMFFQCHVFRESVTRSYGGSSTATAKGYTRSSFICH